MPAAARPSRRVPRWMPLSAFFAALAAAPFAHAASSLYVSPTGTGVECSCDAPCALSTGALLAAAGDTVFLLDGTYTGPLSPANSGTPSAWITFQAAPGATPILDGSTQPANATGVGSNTQTYLRFVGIVARNWSSGFSNGFTGQGTTNSNGHFQYVQCVADMNTRNGFVFNSAQGVLIQQNIVAHSGSSTTASWSSGIQLFEVQGTFQDNVVEQNVSFENADMQNHTDGSGFIVDQMCTGASFVNNIGFRNGGSCIRLTKSTNTYVINNTCFDDGLDP
ncbi:MAG: hypothetical protein JOZ69_15270, partial [Myxococcales bacterium]|nr:hypothetical protein [Myxococcales bacterium]